MHRGATGREQPDSLPRTDDMPGLCVRLRACRDSRFSSWSESHVPQHPAIQFTIYNRRYRGGWLSGATGLVIAGCIVLIVSLLFGNSRSHKEWPLWCAAASVVAGSVLLAIQYGLGAAAHLHLGDDIEIHPLFRPIPPSKVVSIAFAPDAMEDYVESPSPIPVCQATIKLRTKLSGKLIVSIKDAVRLGEWARNKQITVFDPHGFTTVGNAE